MKKFSIGQQVKVIAGIDTGKTGTVILQDDKTA